MTGHVVQQMRASRCCRVTAALGRGLPLRVSAARSPLCHLVSRLTFVAGAAFAFPLADAGDAGEAPESEGADCDATASPPPSAPASLMVRKRKRGQAQGGARVWLLRVEGGEQSGRGFEKSSSESAWTGNSEVASRVSRAGEGTVVSGGSLMPRSSLRTVRSRCGQEGGR